MKKIVMGIVFLTMITANVATSDWQPCIGMIDGTYPFYCDDTNIKYDKETKIAYRLIKVVPTTAMRETLMKDLNDEGAKEKDIKLLSYMIFYEKFDCQKKLQSIGPKIYYDEKGVAFHKTNKPDKWDNFAPGSKAEKSFNKVCNK